MARIPTLQRIRGEDMPNAPGWANNLFTILNLFMESVYSALNKRLTYSDNFNAQSKTLLFTTKADYSNGNFDAITFLKTLPTKATGLHLSQITQIAGTYTPITEGVHVDWRDLGDRISIEHISGLQDNTQYRLTVIVY